MTAKRLLAIVGPSARDHEQRVERIIGRLEKLGCTVELHPADRLAAMRPNQADLAVVFGGDGAFLGAARRLASTGIAVVGVNMGRLGFLTEFSEDEFLDLAPDIVAGRIDARRRMMLDVAVVRDGEQVFSLVAMNEVSLLAGSPYRMIELAISCGDVDLGAFLGDGLIAATPTGSTGHTLSAGGPILAPSLRAIILTPLAAHSLSMRPVVVDPGACVNIKLLRCNEGSAASIDGQESFSLQSGDELVLTSADRDLLVVQNPQRPFFSTLRTKLRWGQGPYYG